MFYKVKINGKEKYTNEVIKHVARSLHSRVETTEDRTSTPEDRPTQGTHPKQQREDRLGNRMNRASRICGTPPQDLTFTSVESQKTEKMGRGGRKIIKGVTSENAPILTKDINLQIQ